HRQIRTLPIGQLRVIHCGCEVRLQCGEVYPDHRLRMVERKERGHSSPKVVAARSIAGIPKLGHELMPALRDVAIIDADLGWTRRKPISGQGRYHYVEVAEHRQHVHIVEETARPAVCEDERYTPAGCRTLAHEVDVLPGEVVEGVESRFPGRPIELIGPIRDKVPQPFQLSALFPANAGYLVWPSRAAQPCPQIVKHFIRDVNLKRFHS